MKISSSPSLTRLILPFITGLLALIIGLTNLLFINLDESLQILSGIITVFGIMFSITSLTGYFKYKNLKTKKKKSGVV